MNSSGLELGKISYEYSDTVPKGKVIRTKPPIGSQIKDGQKVNLIISKGPHLVEMPNVIGESYTVAKKQLVKLGFSVAKLKNILATLRIRLMLKMLSLASKLILIRQL